MSNNWLLIHTKIGQEQRVLEHLQRQGQDCFLPLVHITWVQNGVSQSRPQPMFPRFLFIRQGHPTANAGGRSGLNSQTQDIGAGLGPSLSFRQTFITVDDETMADLQARALNSSHLRSNPHSLVPQKAVDVPAMQQLMKPNAIADTAVADLLQMPSGEDRVMELLNTLSKRLKPKGEQGQNRTPEQWVKPFSTPCFASLPNTLWN